VGNPKTLLNFGKDRSSWALYQGMRLPGYLREFFSVRLVPEYVSQTGTQVPGYVGSLIQLAIFETLQVS
jgi:hypothetical protein